MRNFLFLLKHITLELSGMDLLIEKSFGKVVYKNETK